jgi:hypothetical protein
VGAALLAGGKCGGAFFDIHTPYALTTKRLLPEKAGVVAFSHHDF